jgi:hypothetical protein
MATDDSLEGMRIILEPDFVSERHLRSWKDRLWSWPWRPWMKYRTVPSPEIVLFGDRTLIMHPETWVKTKKILEKRS